MTKVYQMYNTIIIDNFFDNFHILENHFKKIPLTSFEEYPKTIKNNATWPGKRSMPILEINPFLWQLIVKELMNKSQNQKLLNGNWRMEAVAHLRLEEDNTKDWMHKDPDDITMIIFLGKTNLNSGLHIYNEKQEETEYVKYIQNRAVLFNGRSYHKPGNSYGDSVENGRLTLNCFINFVEN